MGLGVPYLYQVVLGVTGAEGSSEEEVEPLRSPASPEELVVLLGIHVELPLGIAPGILGKTEQPAQPGGTSTGITGPPSVHPQHPRAVGKLCFGCSMPTCSISWADPRWDGLCHRTWSSRAGETPDPALTACRKACKNWDVSGERSGREGGEPSETLKVCAVFWVICLAGALWKGVLGSPKPLAQTSLPQFKIRPLLGCNVSPRNCCPSAKSLIFFGQIVLSQNPLAVEDGDKATPRSKAAGYSCASGFEGLEHKTL